VKAAEQAANVTGDAGARGEERVGVEGDVHGVEDRA
jgi:hypothetical protein